MRRVVPRTCACVSLNTDFGMKSWLAFEFHCSFAGSGCLSILLPHHDYVYRRRRRWPARSITIFTSVRQAKKRLDSHCGKSQKTFRHFWHRVASAIISERFCLRRYIDLSWVQIVCARVLFGGRNTQCIDRWPPFIHSLIVFAAMMNGNGRRVSRLWTQCKNASCCQVRLLYFDTLWRQWCANIFEFLNEAIQMQIKKKNGKNSSAHNRQRINMRVRTRQKIREFLAIAKRERCEQTKRRILFNELLSRPRMKNATDW